MNIVIKLFFGADSISDLKKKGILTGVSATTFWGIEWILTLATGILVGIMTGYFQWSEWVIFLVLWGGNLLIALTIVFVNKNIEADFTLMEGARRLVDASSEWSEISGVILETILLIPIVLWEGAGAFAIFFQKRIPTGYMMSIASMGVSGIQMAVWTKTFIFGYGTLEAIKAVIW